MLNKQIFQSCSLFLAEQKYDFVPLHNSKLHRTWVHNLTMIDHWQLSILVANFRPLSKSENFWGGLEPLLPLPLLRACFLLLFISLPPSPLFSWCQGAITTVLSTSRKFVASEKHDIILEVMALFYVRLDWISFWRSHLLTLPWSSGKVCLQIWNRTGR